MAIDSELPLGFLTNTAVILGITLGRQRPDLVGIDVQDKDGNNPNPLINDSGVIWYLFLNAL